MKDRTQARFQLDYHEQRRFLVESRRFKDLVQYVRMFRQRHPDLFLAASYDHDERIAARMLLLRRMVLGFRLATLALILVLLAVLMYMGNP